MRTITLQVPEEVSEEEIQAAVAALLEAKQKPKKEPLDLALFDNLPPSGRTSEEINAALRADRASWGEREKQWQREPKGGRGVLAFAGAHPSGRTAEEIDAEIDAGRAERGI